ncbi:MAG: sulfotransferase domain-containing protein [Planctomycetota bacterium]
MPDGRVDLRLPDFVCVGGQRCATSWLYEAIRGHPAMYLPRKEVHFFNRDYANGLATYAELFAPAAPDQRCGEITPDYLTHPDAAARLAADLPKHTRFLVLLRDPVDRAYSHYQLTRCHGGRTREMTFLEACQRRPHLIDGSRYGHHLHRLVDAVGRERVRAWTDRDITDRPAEMLAEIFAWLDIDTAYAPRDLTARHNVSTGSAWQARLNLPTLLATLNRSPLGPAYRGLRRSSLGHRLRRAVNGPAAPTKRPAPTPDERRALWPTFAHDVDQLERLTSLDLDHWRLANHDAPASTISPIRRAA